MKKVFLLTAFIALIGFANSANAVRKCTASSDPNKNIGHCVAATGGDDCLEGSGAVPCNGTVLQS